MLSDSQHACPCHHHDRKHFLERIEPEYTKKIHRCGVSKIYFYFYTRVVLRACAAFRHKSNCKACYAAEN